MNFDKIASTAATALNMQPRQFAGITKRKFESMANSKLPSNLSPSYESHKPTPPASLAQIETNSKKIRRSLSSSDMSFYEERVKNLQNGNLCLLNTSVDIGDSFPSQVNPHIGLKMNYPRLWSIKLQSFEPSTWISFSDVQSRDRLAEMLAQWLEHWSNIGLFDFKKSDILRGYWTPYAVSRRIVNLSRLAAILSEFDACPEFIITHIYQNVHFLRNHVEYGVGGNHLIENGCALIIGGCIFDCEQIVKQGIDILSSELEKQLTVDGMHFERSPMYHAIILSRVAITVDVYEQFGRRIPTKIRNLIASMLHFLESIAPTDAEFPLLNDSVYKESFSRHSCAQIVKNLTGISPNRNLNLDDSHSESGYHYLESQNAAVLIDGGKPAPSHLPAHAHNDIGNVCVWFDSKPLVVDTGVHSYQPGRRREYARSVEAHNTIQVEDIHQSPTYGRFMMGPRLKPRSTSSASNIGGEATVCYSAPKFIQRYHHRRKVSLNRYTLNIVDYVKSDLENVTSRLHLNPSVIVETPIQSENGCTKIKLRTEDDKKYCVTASGVHSVDIEQTEYYPEYGKVLKQPTIISKGQIRNSNTNPCIVHSITNVATNQ